MTAVSAHPDILTPDVTLVVLTWISFLSLLVILHRFAWKPILEGLKQREEYIRKSLDDADKIKSALIDVETAKAKILDDAKQKANLIVEQSRRLAHELAVQIEQQAKKNAQTIVDSAYEDIQAQRERVRLALIKESAQTVVALAEKILKENCDTEKNRHLIHQAIKDI